MGSAFSICPGWWRAARRDAARRLRRRRRQGGAAGESAIRSGSGPRAAGALWWKVYARNKRFVTLNLKTAEGRELLLRMLPQIRRAHGVVRARDARAARPRLGRPCAARHPGLVLLRISGWGQTGPDSGRPGFGTLVEAASGFAEMNGEPDGAPIVPSFPLADSVTGLYASNAIMFALLPPRRARRGRAGDRSLAVRVAVLAARAAVGGVRRAPAPCARVTAAARATPVRAGATAPRTAGGSRSAARRRRWPSASCAVTGSTRLLEDPRFATNGARVDAHARARR